MLSMVLAYLPCLVCGGGDSSGRQRTAHPPDRHSRNQLPPHWPCCREDQNLDDQGSYSTVMASLFALGKKLVSDLTKEPQHRNLFVHLCITTYRVGGWTFVRNKVLKN